MRAVGFALLAFLLAAPAAAQTQIVVGGVLPSAGSPISLAEDLVIDIDTPRLVRRLPVEFAYGFVPRPPMRTTPDGAFAVSSYLRPFGRLTVGAIGVHRLATGERWLLEGTYADHLIADPRRTAMYFSRSGKVGVLDLSGARSWQACAPPYAIDSVVSALAVAPDASALYVACGTTLLVLDTETGAERSRWQLEKSPTSMHAIAGHRLLVVDWRDTPGAPRHPNLTLYDLDTGALVKSVVAESLTVLVPTPAGDRLLVAYGGTWQLWDAASLTVLAVLPVNLPVTGIIEHEFTRDGRRAVLLRVVAGALHVAVVDVEANALIADVPLGFYHSFDIHGLGLIEPPLPPVGVFAQVLGRTVSLVWSLPQHSATATEYLIEVGATPGTFVAFTSQPASLGTTLQVVDVPRGMYYVRIRGVNAAGIGPPSPGVLVVVQ